MAALGVVNLSSARKYYKDIYIVEEDKKKNDSEWQARKQKQRNEYEYIKINS